MNDTGWLAEARRALAAIAVLARFDRSGAALFGDDPAQCVRSFRACALAFPLFLIVRFGNLLTLDPAHQMASDSIVTQLLEFVIEAVIFPLAALPLLRWYGRDAHWCRLVTAYNWWGLGQAILVTGFVLLYRLSASAPLMADLLVLAYLFSVIVEGFIFEVVLGAGFFTAATLVLIDVVLNQAVSMIAHAIG